MVAPGASHLGTREHKEPRSLALDSPSNLSLIWGKAGGPGPVTSPCHIDGAHGPSLLGAGESTTLHPPRFSLPAKELGCPTLVVRASERQGGFAKISARFADHFPHVSHITNSANSASISKGSQVLVAKSERLVAPPTSLEYFSFSQKARRESRGAVIPSGGSQRTQSTQSRAPG